MERELSARARLDGRSEPPPLASNSVCRRFSEYLELGGVVDLFLMGWTSSEDGIVSVLWLGLRFNLWPRIKPSVNASFG